MLPGGPGASHLVTHGDAVAICHLIFAAFSSKSFPILDTVSFQEKLLFVSRRYSNSNLLNQNKCGAKDKSLAIVVRTGHLSLPSLLSITRRTIKVPDVTPSVWRGQLIADRGIFGLKPRSAGWWHRRIFLSHNRNPLFLLYLQTDYGFRKNLCVPKMTCVSSAKYGTATSASAGSFVSEEKCPKR